MTIRLQDRTRFKDYCRMYGGGPIKIAKQVGDDPDLAELLAGYDLRKLEVFHKLCKTRLKPFFGSPKATIQLREEINHRKALTWNKTSNP